MHTHKFLAAISREAHVGVVHLEDAAFLVRHPEAVSARFDHSPILGLATAEGLFSLLSNVLLRKMVHGEGDRVGDFFKQANLPVLEDVLFSGVDDEHAAKLSPETKGQGGCRAEAMGDRPFPPDVRPGIVHEVVNDAGLPGSDANANGTKAFRPFIGVDLDAVQISLLVTGALRSARRRASRDRASPPRQP